MFGPGSFAPESSENRTQAIRVHSEDDSKGLFIPPSPATAAASPQTNSPIPPPAPPPPPPASPSSTPANPPPPPAAPPPGIPVLHTSVSRLNSPAASCFASAPASNGPACALFTATNHCAADALPGNGGGALGPAADAPAPCRIVLLI